MKKSLQILSLFLASSQVSVSALSMADPSAARAKMADGSSKKFYGGAGIGRFSLDDGTEWKCAYDMVLVERIQGKPKTESGLFVPQEDLPKLHLCRGKSIACIMLYMYNERFTF